MLVYEKVIRKPIRLEFNSVEEQNEVLSKFGLCDSIYQPPEKMVEEECISKGEMTEETVERDR
jgi:hypothetical protein